MAEQVKIGVIGGTGLYQMDALKNIQEHTINTPFGYPSDTIITGTLQGHSVAFLSRHGRGHVLTPSEVPYRANIYALKSLGVEYIIAVSACGSLQEEYEPSHIMLPDQLVDFTKNRVSSFFGEGVVAHVGVAEPFCETLRHILADAVENNGGIAHRQGKFITIEGPRFSTRAESHLYRQWGMDIIGMTTSPEAFLAREAEICYAVMAMITDYDVWHEEEVHVEMVLQNFKRNLDMAKRVLLEAIPQIGILKQSQPAHTALKGTLTTAREKITPAQVEKFKYFRNLIG
jgi:5'-methylthioadenosine phosphorylase